MWYNENLDHAIAIILASSVSQSPSGADRCFSGSLLFPLVQRGLGCRSNKRQCTTKGYQICKAFSTNQFNFETMYLAFFVVCAHSTWGWGWFECDNLPFVWCNRNFENFITIISCHCCCFLLVRLIESKVKQTHF